MTTCLKGLNHWSVYLTRDPFVYPGNDILELACVQASHQVMNGACWSQADKFQFVCSRSVYQASCALNVNLSVIRGIKETTVIDDMEMASNRCISFLDSRRYHQYLHIFSDDCFIYTAQISPCSINWMAHVVEIPRRGRKKGLSWFQHYKMLPDHREHGRGYIKQETLMQSISCITILRGNTTGVLQGSELHRIYEITIIRRMPVSVDNICWHLNSPMISRGLCNLVRMTSHLSHDIIRADSSFVFSQWETVLLCKMIR